MDQGGGLLESWFGFGVLRSSFLVYVRSNDVVLSSYPATGDPENGQRKVTEPPVPSW